MSATAPDLFPTPVLLLVFNRPETTRNVLAALRLARPARLYVAADGPRANRPSDVALCQEVRDMVLAGIDWPCEVKTLFRDTNLNCGVGPASAIDWFFRQEPEGIILEDDCVPTPAFFPFCQELLARYRDDKRVMHIGGNNFSRKAQSLPPAGADSYFFSQHVNSWGWASWRRAWQLYDFHLGLWPELKRRGLLRQLYPSVLERRYWLPKFAALYDVPQPPDIWDYQWHFAVAANSGLTIVPAVNLVRNIGFGDDATHTFNATDSQANVATIDLPLPLQHPPMVLRDLPQDQQRFREFLFDRVSHQLQKLPARLRQLTQRPQPTANPVPPLVTADPSLSPSTEMARS